MIKTKSGKKFPESRIDWKWWDSSVPAKLKELHKNGKKIVIFTNQAGINGKNGYDNTKEVQIKGKIQDIQKELGIPLQAFIATTDDIYRKPSTSLWELMASKHNGGVKIDKAKSIYVGDAAGRPAVTGKKKDFSCSDRKFAYNVGIKFKTPEEFFLGQAEDKTWDWGGITPEQLQQSLKNNQVIEGAQNTLVSDKPEVVLFCGRPASGKSTFAKTWFAPKGYEIVNRDTLKTQEKCCKHAGMALDQGKSVVVDNTCPDMTARSLYVNLAKDHKVPIR